MQPPNLSFPGNKQLLYARSLLFFLGMLIFTLVIAPIMIISAILPFRYRYAIANIWVVLTLWWLRLSCGLSHRVEGVENIPEKNAIIFCNHQSAWETIALQTIFPAQVFITKRELLHLPFFGWALATQEPIAIDRKAKKAALKQVIDQGIDRLNKGRFVVVFPEGTRTAPGKKRPYKLGGSNLAEQSGFPVVPVAHNAGEFWGRYSFLKFPGVIKLRIGPVINPQGMTAPEINEAAKDWIERNKTEISTVSKN